MSPDHLFSCVNGVALASWLLLIALPRQRWVTGVVTQTLVPLLFASLYVAVVVAVIGQTGGGFATLDGVAAIFTNRWLLLAGWVHYLAFDLLVGSWEGRDAHARGIRHAFVVPCLLLTFLFGPAGWLLYRAVRALATRAHVPHAANGA